MSEEPTHPYTAVEVEPGTSKSKSLHAAFEQRKGYYGRYPVSVSRVDGAEVWLLAKTDDLPPGYLEHRVDR